MSQHHFQTSDPELAKLHLELLALETEWAEIKRGLATKFDPAQLRAPAGTSIGGQWIRNFLSIAARGPITPLKVVIGAAAATGLALYESLSANDSKRQKTVIEFRAKLFQKDEFGRLDLVGSRALTRDEVNEACPGLDKLQKQVDRIASEVRAEKPNLTPPRFGTEVHKRLADEIRELKDPNFQAEVSVLKSTKVKYGTPGSKRIDTYKRERETTICAYDLKTENAILDSDRIIEIAVNAWNAFQNMEKLIIAQVKPFQ